MADNYKIDSAVITVGKWIVRILMVILIICLVFGSLHLIRTIYLKVIEPPFMMLDVITLFEIFNLILIIAVGYELIKSLHTIITSDTIPAADITLIAIIAVANKIITLDIKHTEPAMLYGLAAVMLTLGAGYFFLKRNNDKPAH